MTRYGESGFASTLETSNVVEQSVRAKSTFYMLYIEYLLQESRLSPVLAPFDYQFPSRWWRIGNARRHLPCLLRDEDHGRPLRCILVSGAEEWLSNGFNDFGSSLQ